MKVTIKELVKTATTDREFLDVLLYLSPVMTFLVSIIIFLELNKELWK